MTWVTVKDFDLDVRVGDRLTRPEYYERIVIVRHIGKQEFFYEFEDSKCGDEGSSRKSFDWQVWRETKRWKPEPGGHYYYAIATGGVCKHECIGHQLDHLFFNSGNFFRTSEQAQEYADECKKVAERLHEKWGE